jgi:hypothetical protein
MAFEVLAMSTRKLTLAVQLVLGAVFGTVLVWKQMRARDRVVLASSDSGQWAGWAFDAERRQAAAHGTSRRSGESAADSGAIPSGLRIAVLMFAAAAVPVLIGVTWAVTRTGGSTTAPPQINVPSRTAPVTTAPAVATATLAEQWLDAHRAFDLDAVRKAADAYAVYFHGYPTTNGRLTPLCAARDDPGCEIGKYATSFPTSDGEHAYWYASDGTSITLVAQVTTPPKTDDCPAGLTSPLGDVPVLCVNSSLSGR